MLIERRILAPGQDQYGSNATYEDLAGKPRGAWLHLHGLHVQFEQDTDQELYHVSACVHGQVRLHPANGTPGDYVQIHAGLFHRAPGQAELTLILGTEQSVVLAAQPAVQGFGPDGGWSLDQAHLYFPSLVLHGAGAHEIAAQVRLFYSPVNRVEGSGATRDFVLVPSNENGRSYLQVERVDE